MRRLLLLLACSLLFAGCGSGDEPPSAARPAADTRALAGAPKPLAALHEQSSQLLDGGVDAFQARLKRLRGYPVVVNKWASWCPPCRAEFPFFQRQGVKRGKEVAFLGVDSDDHDGSAREFLREYPVPFPTYKDPKLEIAASFDAVLAFPSTAFYDAKGKLAYVHQGVYSDERKLARDIERYAR